MAFACMASGIMEVRSNQIQGFYTYGNSPFVGYNGTNDVRITGVSFDKYSKLWASITIGKNVYL